MIDYTEIRISQLVTHFIGNKLRTEGIKLSEEINQVGASTTKYLLDFFITPFRKLDFYCFNHNIELNYNEVYSLCEKIFNSPKSIIKHSKSIAKHLYENSLHPRIKGGELTVVYFENCIHNDEVIDAIGLFKTETKDIFLKINGNSNHFIFKHEEGININKLEKGCLVFNTDQDKGYKVLIIDRVATEEAQYWKNTFLNLKVFNNDYTQTKALIELTSSFLANKIDEQVELSKTDKIEVLNKSLEYFQNTKKYKEKEFVETVLDSSPEVYKAFKEHRKELAENKNFEIESSFEVSHEALKKSAKTFKSVIKLDKSFEISVNGSTEFIERGFDKQKGKHYYKLYFDKEH